MASSSTGSDLFFMILAILAAGCVGAIITLQVFEWQYYSDPEDIHGGTVWCEDGQPRWEPW